MRVQMEEMSKLGWLYVWNEAKVLQIEPNTTYKKYKESPICLW
jgi:hypothetical protein